MKLQGNIEEIKKRMLVMGKDGSGLARSAGVSTSTVYHILAGGATKPYTAKKISYALLRGVDKLFHEYKGDDGNEGKGS